MEYVVYVLGAPLTPTVNWVDCKAIRYSYSSSLTVLKLSESAVVLNLLKSYIVIFLVTASVNLLTGLCCTILSHINSVYLTNAGDNNCLHSFSHFTSKL